MSQNPIAVPSIVFTILAILILLCSITLLGLSSATYNNLTWPPINYFPIYYKFTVTAFSLLCAIFGIFVGILTILITIVGIANPILILLNFICTLMANMWGWLAAGMMATVWGPSPTYYNQYDAVFYSQFAFNIIVAALCVIFAFLQAASFRVGGDPK